MSILCTTKELEVIRIKKETKALGFVDLKIGDVFQLATTLKNTGYRTHGAYVKYFLMRINNGPWFETAHTYNTIEKYLDCFEVNER